MIWESTAWLERSRVAVFHENSGLVGAARLGQGGSWTVDDLERDDRGFGCPKDTCDLVVP